MKKIKSKKLKLFVWENVLCDYTDGIMFALAPNVDTARKNLLKRYNYIPGGDLGQTPKIYTKPVAHAVWGGG